MQELPTYIPLNPASCRALQKLKVNPLIPGGPLAMSRNQVEHRNYGSPLSRNHSERSLSSHSNQREGRQEIRKVVPNITFNGQAVIRAQSSLLETSASRVGSKLRSSSVTQFSSNETESRVHGLEMKLVANNQEIVALTHRLSQK